jgi:hypothetical protein
MRVKNLAIYLSLPRAFGSTSAETILDSLTVETNLYEPRIRSSNMAIIKQIPFSLEVTVAGTFLESIAPTAQIVPKGIMADYIVTVLGQDGFDSSVMLSVDGLPSGVSPTFQKNPVVPGDSVRLSIPTDALTKNLIYNLTLTGTEMI